MARKVKSQELDAQRWVIRELIEGNIQKLDKERLVEFFRQLTSEQQAYLLGMPMYVPCVGEDVVVNDEQTGVVASVNLRDLDCRITYPTTDTRYFKTTEAKDNFESNGSFNSSTGSYYRQDEYPYVGKREVVSEHYHKLAEIAPANIP